MAKKIYRSRTDRKIAGVCGGVADFFNIDVTIIRLIYVFITIFATAIIGGVLFYFLCAFIIPNEPKHKKIAD